MNTSLAQVSGNDASQLPMQQLIDGLAEAQRQACRMLWETIKEKLLENWPLVSGVLVFVLVAAVATYMLTGRWGFLGSVLYHYIYFGLLFLLILIWGPEIFANVWIDIILFGLYLVCFALVGMFVNATGIRRSHGKWIDP